MIKDKEQIRKLYELKHNIRALSDKITPIINDIIDLDKLGIDKELGHIYTAYLCKKVSDINEMICELDNQASQYIPIDYEELNY